MSGYSPPITGRVTLRFKVEHYLDLAAARGWKTQEEQAIGLGLSQPSVGKILAGKQTPGPDGIAALLNTFGMDKFPDLFEVVGVEAQQGAA